MSGESWLVVDGLWMVVAGCGSLWLILGGFGWLWVVLAGCGWFWLVPHFSMYALLSQFS